MLKAKNWQNRKNLQRLSVVVFLTVSFLLISCSDLKKPKTETYYGENKPPIKQEFRWSNGKIPQSFDPALAVAAPETDIVRAIYEGLTDVDSKSLEPIPAIAAKWTASQDYKKWTFYLRKDAKWSNGEKVKAKHFVKSWQRLADLGEKLPQPNLIKNIVGIKVSEKGNNDSFETDVDTFKVPNNSETAIPKAKFIQSESKKIQKTDKLAVFATDDYTLEVSLENADEDFPALVSHPMFRPIYDEKEFLENPLNAGITTNGAFRIISVGKDGITLDRADYYWNKEKVELERVRFIPAENAEKALQSYKSGDLDAITNAAFEPLALKLLNPYLDVKRTKHSALNYYEINLQRPPFNDLRIREALAVSIERKRLTEDDMDGATEPALNFLPFAETYHFNENVEHGRKLLSEAGFPNGENFPIIQLVVNRNDTQKRIARSIAKMWKKNLNIETSIIIKEKNEIENARKNGEYDIIRRGVVMPTANETVSLMTMFVAGKNATEKKTHSPLSEKTNHSQTETETLTNERILKDEFGQENSEEKTSAESNEEKLILTEAEAIKEIPAIPLYFPTSYSFVKPYVQGFDANVLDAPSLKAVKIDNFWQPTKEKVIPKDNDN